MVEGPSRRDPAMTSGRTAQNKLIHFAGPAERPLTPGSVADVLVTGAGAHSLRGELVGVTARPNRRVRIPVVAS